MISVSATRIVCIVAFLIMVVTVDSHADDNPEISSERYHSLRGTVYSQNLTSIEEHGYQSRFKLRLTAAIYKYESIEQIFDDDLLHLQSYGVRPGFELKIPTQWKKIHFIPNIDLSVTYQNELEKTLISGSVYTGFDYHQKLDESVFGTTLGFKYGTKYDKDALNVDEYIELIASARLEEIRDWNVGEHRATVTPFITASYYMGELELGVNDEKISEVERRYSIGVSFGTSPSKKIWKVKIPEIRLSYEFGDGVKGIKIRF